MNLLSPLFIVGHVVPIKSAASNLVLLVLVIVLLAPSVHGCSCSPPPHTASERATTIMNSEWTNLVVLARFTKKTAYIDVDENREHGLPIELKTQNTTFIVKEILFNRDPNSPLQNIVEVQPDGTMLVHKSTVADGPCPPSSMSAQDIGKDYLLTIHKYGDSLGMGPCGNSCHIGGGLCHETANELRTMNNECTDLNRKMCIKSTTCRWAEGLRPGLGCEAMSNPDVSLAQTSSPTSQPTSVSTDTLEATAPPSESVVVSALPSKKPTQVPTTSPSNEVSILNLLLYSDIFSLALSLSLSLII